MGLSLQLDLPRDPTAAAHARQLLTERLSARLSRAELDTARLLASELVNNAVLHGHGRITLSVEADVDRLRVDVRDEGDGFVHLVRSAGTDNLGGRGLQIVDALASRWGVYDGTTHVWFELARSRLRTDTG